MHNFKTHINNPKKHVKYIGVMDMEQYGRIELFNLLHQVGEHPVDSTVSRQTLEKHGITVPPFEELVKGEQY